MKRSVLATMLVALTLLVFTSCAPIHYDETNISRRYDREWILGKTRAEIEAKYGDFDREFVSDEGEILGAFYVNYENRGVDPSYIHDTYFVRFDEADVAVDAFFRETSIGG